MAHRLTRRYRPAWRALVGALEATLVALTFACSGGGNDPTGPDLPGGPLPGPEQPGPPSSPVLVRNSPALARYSLVPDRVPSNPAASRARTRWSRSTTPSRGRW